MVSVTGAAAAALALGTSLNAPAAQADTDEFSFADCPKLAANYDPARSFCFSVQVIGGKITLGKVDKPIDKPIQMTYGSLWNKTTNDPESVFGKMRAQPILIEGVFGDPLLTAVYATPEFAGGFAQPPVGNFLTQINLKIRLQGRVLPVDCHLGSDSNPIKLNLTTGTTNPPPPNQPMSGVPLKTVSSDPTMSIKTATHVDNAFAVPGANGCGLINGGLLDTIINSQAGTPSAAGKNTMVFSERIGVKRYDRL
jgi:hypothetical protein